MKVVAFNGSPRRDGNTTILINRVFEELDREGIETELYTLAGKRIRGCVACYKCWSKKNGRCANDEDVLNECIEKIVAADGVIFGSPTYFMNVTPELKALIDRTGMVAMANGGMFRRKVGAAVVAVRRAGAVHVLDSIHHHFLMAQMIVPGSRYLNIGYGLDKGEVEKDQEGMLTMQTLGENMAWLLKKLQV
ncbi:MAG: flavodoxin family protein [Desulfomonile tiedjei]|nr:flavodoxin family protein [Desulfomonile tiedjei]